MAKRRILGVFLLLSHLGGLLAPAWAAAGDGDEPPPDVVVSENIEQRAGGWNLATPILIAGSELYQGARGEGDGLQVDDLANRRVVGGLAGDAGALGAAALAARFLPMPPVARVALMTAAGFLGWEFGSGDSQHTDWVELGAQIAAASAVQFLLPIALASAGIAIGPVALMAAGVAAAVGTGMLVSWLRNRGKKDDEPEAPLLDTPPTAFLGPGTIGDEASPSGERPERPRSDLFGTIGMVGAD